MNKAVFIDRDGTIAEDVGYCDHPRKFKLYEESGPAIKRLNDAGYKVIVITNQSGIARGKFTHVMLGHIHNKMIQELEKDGAHIDDIYYCPHLPSAHCECRKPKTELLHNAIEKYKINLNKSWMIGNSIADIELAFNTGKDFRSILVRNDGLGYLMPTYHVATLKEAVEIICNTDKYKHLVNKYQ